VARKKLIVPGYTPTNNPIPCATSGCQNNAILSVGGHNFCRPCYVAIPVDSMLALRSGRQREPGDDDEVIL